ncbi:hypothetical protein BC629DRAFT_1664323 [Irpex lacteus]|nr:hypothetical protein BC629DRAFT_1664323 [Irpex lacteus]
MNEGTKLYPFILDDSEPGDELDAYKPAPPPQATIKEEEDEEEHCSICLQPLSDRTIIPACSHEFCFECLLVWTEQSRRCPLCSGQIGEYLIHDIRSKYDFSKHYLNPLRSSPRPDPPVSRVAGTRRRGQGREAVWGRNERRERERERRAADELDRAIEKRRWIYRHNLYAMHVASNPYTRYKPFPTPAQFASNPDLISRATIFVRRELRVWDALDVEFLTTFTISLMKSIDIRSESAVKLLAEFLDMDTGERTNAEHFAHELYCYLRSPYRDLVRYDAAVQYDTPEHVPAVAYRHRSNRWEDDGSPHSPNTLGDAGPSNIHGGTPARSHSQQESRDAVRESSKERKERSTPRSPEVQEVHRVGLGDHRRLSIGTSDQREIPQNIKGKGRAIDEDGDSPLTSRPVQEQNSTVAMLETETSHSAQKDATTTATVADEAPVIQPSHESSTSKQRDRPKS